MFSLLSVSVITTLWKIMKVILRGSSIPDKHHYEIYYHIIEWHVPPCSQNYWVPQNKSNKMWRWKDAWRVCFLLLPPHPFFFKCICTILMALADKVHRLWLEQEAFHRTCLGGKYIFTCFYVVTDLFFFVCVFVLLSLLPSGFPWVSVATCIHQLLLIFFIFYVLLLFQTFSFHLYFLTPVSSPPASLRSLAFTRPGFCVFTFFPTAPPHTSLLEFLILSALAQRTALLSLFHSVSNRDRNRSVVFGFISNWEKGNASEAALSLLLCSTSH